MKVARHTKPKLRTTWRGLGAEHQTLRKRWERFFAGGGAERCSIGPDCYWAEEENGLLVGGWITHGMEWDLDHTPDRKGYRGPAHAKCNRSDGARRRNAKTRRSRQW